MRSFFALIGAAAISASSLHAQAASLVYKLGKDTVAIEQYTHSATALAGEMVQRNGTAVVRYQYSLTLGKDGRPVSAMIKRMQPDGSSAPNGPTEVRFTIGADSVIRETVFTDSTSRRAFAASRALINFPTFVYGPTELLAGLRKSGAVDSLAAVGTGGGVSFTGLTTLSGDSARLRGGAYAMVLRFDASSRLQSVDGSGTTNKVMAARGAGGMDIAGIARGMKPTGLLSVREDARAAFGPGGMVVVDYGRPQVRERSVWGGVLVPFDSVWRAGANDATHLFTTRTLTLGTLTVPPGMYTLWVQHTRDATYLIVNRQTGQWGTQYDAAQDLGRVPMQMTATPSHVEEFTITVRAINPSRGELAMTWESKVATVSFGVTNAR